jgi:hypothetical protein
MTVKELIEILKLQDPNQRVILDYEDHTDWCYRMDFNEEEIITDFELCVGWDDNEDEITEKVFLIECKESNDISPNF